MPPCWFQKLGVSMMQHSLANDGDDDVADDDSSGGGASGSIDSSSGSEDSDLEEVEEEEEEEWRPNEEEDNEEDFFEVIGFKETQRAPLKRLKVRITTLASCIQYFVSLGCNAG